MRKIRVRKTEIMRERKSKNGIRREEILENEIMKKKKSKKE